MCKLFPIYSTNNDNCLCTILYFIPFSVTSPQKKYFNELDLTMLLFFTLSGYSLPHFMSINSFFNTVSVSRYSHPRPRLARSSSFFLIMLFKDICFIKIYKFFLSFLLIFYTYILRIYIFQN